MATTQRRKPAARRAAVKAPGARPGDFVFNAAKGPIPLPPLEAYSPNAAIAADFDDLADVMRSSDAAASDGANMSRAGKLLFRMIESGLPDDYLGPFRERVQMKELGPLMSAWRKANGGVGPGE